MWHTGETPHRCDFCSKTFTRKEHLLNHVRQHTGESPHRCGFCNKSFTRKEHLVNHIRQHTGESGWQMFTSRATSYYSSFHFLFFIFVFSLVSLNNVSQSLLVVYIFIMCRTWRDLTVNRARSRLGDGIEKKKKTKLGQKTNLLVSYLHRIFSRMFILVTISNNADTCERIFFLFFVIML